MGKIRKWGGAVLYLVACMIGIGLLFAGLQTWKSAGVLCKNVNLLCEEKMTSSEIRAIRAAEAEKEEAMEFTAWTMAGKQYIQDAEKYQRAETEVIELNGSSELLISYGSVLHTEDTEGCLLGKKTAERLFGNTNAKGQSVCYKERILVVRGILWETDEIIVVQAEEGTSFERITLQGAYGITKSMQAARFCMNYGIPASLLRAEIFTEDFLRELVPGKWSDFEGWKNNADIFFRGAALYKGCAKSGVEQQYSVAQSRGKLLVVLGAVIMIFLFSHNQYICAIPQAAVAIHNNLAARRKSFH